MFLMALALFSTGLFAQTKTQMKTGDLAKPITQYIAQNYSGYSAMNAFKINAKGVLSYEVKIGKESEEAYLFFDKDGKFIRKEVAMKAEKQKPAATQPAQQQHQQPHQQPHPQQQTHPSGSHVKK